MASQSVNDDSMQASINKAGAALRDLTGRRMGIRYSQHGFEASVFIDEIEVFGGQGRSIQFAAEAFLDGVTVGTYFASHHTSPKKETGRQGAKVVHPENVFDEHFRKDFAKQIVTGELNTETVLVLIRTAFVAGMNRE